MSRLLQELREKAALIANSIAFVAVLVAILFGLRQSRQTEEALRISQAGNRPFVYLGLENTKNADGDTRIAITASNTGSLPARIVFHTGQPWVDDVTREAAKSDHVFVLYPGEEDRVLRALDLSGDLPRAVISGEAVLKYGVAVLYESATSGDNRTWASVLWVGYAPRKPAFSVRERDDFEFESSERDIDLAEHLPSGCPTWQP